MKHHTHSKQRALTMAGRLLDWQAPEGVEFEVTLLPVGERFAVFVNLESGDLLTQIEVKVLNDRTFATIQREAEELLEAAWVAAGTVTAILPFDLDAIPRG